VWGVLAVLAAGVFARFYQYALHFAPYDDLGAVKSILDYRHQGKFGLFAVPRHWNYSPFQFLITPFLIDLDLPYRELLARARLPSVIFSSLSLVMMAVICFMVDQWRSARVLWAVTLMAVSWEYLIFTQQMHNYAAGVLGATGMLGALIYALNHEDMSAKAWASTGFLCAVLGSLQYSVLFFLPAFLAVLSLRDFLAKKSARILLLDYGCFTASFGMAFFPVWFFFLKNHVASGNAGLSDWNKGLSGEFLFSINPGLTFPEKAAYVYDFFVHNSFLVFQATTGFLPESHPLALYLGMVFFILFFFGLGSLAYDPVLVRRRLGFFVTGVLCSWVVLVVARKLTLSPTRHHLVLLPVFSLIVAEGIARFGGWIRARLNPGPKISGLTNFCLLLSVWAGFFAGFPAYWELYKDPFDEDYLLAKIKEYEVDAVIPALWTLQVEMMPSVRRHYGYEKEKFIPGFKSYDLITREGQARYKRIAWISRRQLLTREHFESARRQLNQYLNVTNYLYGRMGFKPRGFLRFPFDAYRVIYQDVRHSDREIEYRGLTKSDTNGFYFYILEREF
jgi:hypothetical protein